MGLIAIFQDSYKHGSTARPWCCAAVKNGRYTQVTAHETRNEALRDLRHRTNAVPHTLRIWSDKTNKERNA